MYYIQQLLVLGTEYFKPWSSDGQRIKHRNEVIILLLLNKIYNVPHKTLGHTNCINKSNPKNIFFFSEQHQNQPQKKSP